MWIPAKTFVYFCSGADQLVTRFIYNTPGRAPISEENARFWRIVLDALRRKTGGLDVMIFSVTVVPVINTVRVCVCVCVSTRRVCFYVCVCV